MILWPFLAYSTTNLTPTHAAPNLKTISALPDLKTRKRKFRQVIVVAPPPPKEKLQNNNMECKEILMNYEIIILLNNVISIPST